MKLSLVLSLSTLVFANSHHGHSRRAVIEPISVVQNRTIIEKVPTYVPTPVPTQVIQPTPCKVCVETDIQTPPVLCNKGQYTHNVFQTPNKTLFPYANEMRSLHRRRYNNGYAYYPNYNFESNYNYTTPYRVVYSEPTNLISEARYYVPTTQDNIAYSYRPYYYGNSSAYYPANGFLPFSKSYQYSYPVRVIRRGY